MHIFVLTAFSHHNFFDLSSLMHEEHASFYNIFQNNINFHLLLTCIHDKENQSVLPEVQTDKFYVKETVFQVPQAPFHHFILNTKKPP